MKSLYLKARSQEWKDLRNQYITGTEVASLFALNPYKSIAKIMREKTTGQEEPVEDNEHMQAGRYAEAAIVVKLNDMGLKVVPAADNNKVNFCYLEDVRLSVSLDAILPDYPKGQYIPVEIKSTLNKFEDYEQGYIPQYYLMQCQAQLIVLKSPYLILSASHQSRLFPTVLFKILPNKEIHKIVVDSVSRFWDNKSMGDKFKIDQDDKKRILELLPQTIERYNV